MPTRLKALIIAHDARATGGVNNFLRIMRIKMRPRVEASRFANGRRHGERGRVQTLKRLLTDYLRFAVLLRRRRFDVIHLNPTLDLSSLPRELLFVWLARIFQPNARILLFYRGWNWNALDGIRRSRFGLRLFLTTQSRVDRILVLSSAFKAALVAEGVPTKRIHVVTTMFEGDAMSPALEAVKVKEPKTVVFMSRFLPAKGGATLIQAFARLTSGHPKSRLIMAGDGPDNLRLRALAEHHGIIDRVEFTGYVGGLRKMSLLARASIFALPTAHPEGMPNAILEAMAAGDVIISTAVGGIPDVVEDGVNGVIIKADDVDQLTAAIASFLEDPVRTAQISDLNKAKAWRLWESKVVADSIADHYAELTGPIGAEKG